MKPRFLRLALVLVLALILLATLNKVAEISASIPSPEAPAAAGAASTLASADASASQTLLQGATSFSSFDPTSPTQPIRLIFIHHSTGEAWLADDYGDLGEALRDNDYFVSDTNYGWGPDDLDKGYDKIGDHTDIPDWYSWFTGPHRDTYLTALYSDSDQHSSYSRMTIPAPSGENRIIMFKSCFPNSNMGGNPDDPPALSADYNSDITVANAKRIYLDLSSYFATRPEKLFVVITAPPRATYDGYNPDEGANARAFNDWLVDDVNGWLKDYPYRNVAVFDYFNVLTGPNNHHRYNNGVIEHITSTNNSSYYPTGDSHPSEAGDQKATAEFLPLLNIYYHRWQEGTSYKMASDGTPSQGQAVTYTIVIRGLEAPLSATVYLTDVVPTDLSYLPGTLEATSGVTAENANTLTWVGVLTPTHAVTLTYVVTVNTALTLAINNTAVIVAPGYLTLTRSATIFANGYNTYLPLVTLNYSPPAPSGQAIVIDHTCTDLSKVPVYWINRAKEQLRLCYGHTSHGSQLVSGMSTLKAGNLLYDYNTNGAIQAGVLSLADYMPTGDLGSPDRVTWASMTRAYLNGSGSNRNTVMWSWCGQAETTNSIACAKAKRLGGCWPVWPGGMESLNNG